MPEGALYVGRPSQWGNPFSIEKHGRIAALEYFRSYLTGHFDLVPTQAHREYRAAEKRLYGRGPAMLEPGELAVIFLRGHDLACWCPEACGVEVALYGVDYGDLYEPCGNLGGHDGGHDPSVAPWCHADVLLELASA